MAPTDKPQSHGPAFAAALFGISENDLMIGGLPVRDIVAGTGTPCFLYDASAMRRAYRNLETALSGFADIYYSVKANPLPAIISLFRQEGAGAEIASVGEYRAAIKAGVAPEKIIFAGPGKSKAELREVIEGGIGEIHIESAEEIGRIEAIGKPVKASIRINPVPDAQAGAMRMGGKATAFGFDEEELENVLPLFKDARYIDLVGVHIYGGTQILDADMLVSQWRHSILLAARMAGMLGKPLETIDLGGGLGIPYFAGETPLDLAAVSAAIPDLKALVKAHPLITDAHVIVEPGRFLAGSGGVYVAEVNSVKTSRGTTFVVMDGGMHHHLAASGNLGQIVKRNYPIVAPAMMQADYEETATIVGPLCTPLDTLARNAALPKLKAGDLLAILQSGAYGATASPSGFLSHPVAKEVLIEDGDIAIVTSARDRAGDNIATLTSENPHQTLRIYDIREGVIAADLYDLLHLLAPASQTATWVVSTVKSLQSADEWFEVVGESRDDLEMLAQKDARISGAVLADLAKKAKQVIWGQFTALSPALDQEWVTIRAIDSSFYEVTTPDANVQDKIKSFFRDVRPTDSQYR
nr:type III PLP-dependent enzyme [Agrobacterium tumefaciens]